jgi:integrase
MNRLNWFGKTPCRRSMHFRGVPMAVIVKWLGHADASITAKIYAHSQDDGLRCWADFGRGWAIVVTPRPDRG